MCPAEEQRQRGDDSERQAAGRKENVERNDVDDDGREDHDTERNHAEKPERSPEHLRGEEQRQYVAARRQGAEESDCRLRHRWLRKELEEAIQSEHDEDQPEQDPRDSHRRLHSISSVAARLRGGMAPRRPVAPSSTGR